MSQPQPPERLDADEALAAVRGARPSDAVRRRITERAIEGRSTRRWIVPVAGLATAAAALLVWLVVPADATGDRLEVGRHTVVRAPQSELEVVRRSADRTLVRLSSGAADFEIQPLGEGQSFRVRTPEVEVEVVGTAFRVSTADGCSTVTVSEGRVRVTAGQASSLLGAGESTHHCASAVEAPAPGEALVREAQGLMLSPDRAGEAAALFSRYLEAHADGVFREEAMFHLAFAERMAGRDGAAREAAARFLDTFPDSRRAGRMRDAFADGP